VALNPALAALVSSLKADEKAEQSASNMLIKIIDDYCKTGAFDKYLEHHSRDAAKYLYAEHPQERRGLFRASSAGKCRQAEVFKIIHEPKTNDAKRKPGNFRALHNGTFTHARYHLLFDALHERGDIETLAAEELRFNSKYQLSGTIDRAIAIPFKQDTWVGILDFKSIKEVYYNRLIGAQDDHKRQQEAYGILGWQDRESPDSSAWMMMYENKNTHELKAYARSYDSEIRKELIDSWAASIEWMGQYAKTNVAPFTLPLDTEWCSWCPWLKRCKELNGCPL